ncbi:MAG: hypothetical protein CM1200mP21_05000 [Candidatus Poseidoniales archaeon]|nr:MAG: hypothetical protein CM1200mP21_05000 [Candidatus Poseidoniales archaeon]
MGGAGLIGLLFVGAVIVAASSAGKDEVDYDEEEFGGSVMVIDGCKDCGNFWFDRKELKTVTVAEKIRAAKEWEEEATRPMLRPEGFPYQASGRASNTNCLHIDEKNGKNCRRVTFRSTKVLLYAPTGLIEWPIGAKVFGRITEIPVKEMLVVNLSSVINTRTRKKTI